MSRQIQRGGWSVRQVALVAGGLIAAGGALLYAYYQSTSSKEPSAAVVKQSGTPAKKSASKKSPAAAPARNKALGSLEAIDDKTLFERVAQSLQRLEKEERAINAEDKELYKIVSNLNPADRSQRTRVISAQWLLMFQTFTFLSEVKTVKGLKEKQNEHKVDTLLMWDLLDFESDDARQAVAVDLLRIDIATRLKDGPKLAKTFDRLISRRQLGPHESIVVFSMAPLVGRWNDFVNVAEQLIKDKPDLLAQFHHAAIEASAQNEVADYAVLYDLATKFKKANEPSARLEDLQWVSYEFVEGRQAVTKASAEDESTQQQLDSEVQKGASGDWDPFESFEAPKPLEVTGAIAHMSSLNAEIPIPLVGRATANKISMEGFIELADENESTRIKISETIDLERSSKPEDVKDLPEGVSCWVGTQSTKHVSSEGAEILSIYMRVQYRLKTV